ncbi:MAG TPA: glucoamylase family protein, partial [Gemmatimonadaceae bacterium]|nr:glucoamylase family protein [Gemmatimonadaceae bacterium]
MTDRGRHFWTVTFMAAARITRAAAATLVLAATALGIPGCVNSPAPSTASPVPPASPDDPFLDTVQTRTFRWFWDVTDHRTGLTPDRWPTLSFSSVGAIGFGLTAYVVGAERGYVSRTQAAERTLNTLQFLYRLPQDSASTGVAGYKGFFYHFLRLDDGLRFEQVELSSIDTALLFMGALACREYFDRADATEASIRAYADSLYHRADWRWFVKTPPLVSMGWHPERGGAFNTYNWAGFNEGMFLYVLALGSPTHAIDPAAWQEWTRTYRWDAFSGQPHVNFAPLFGHQYSHVWIDFRGIQDSYMRARGIDYFENSKRATIAQRQYAIDNPHDWLDYGHNVWGLTASDGPKDTTVFWNGQERRFWTYTARGVAAGELRDDGTIVPTATG